MNDTPQIPPPMAATTSAPAAAVSIWMRFVALIVDNLIAIIPAVIVMLILPLPAIVEMILQPLLAGAILIAINWNNLQTGQTIAKKMFNLRVVRKDGSPISRDDLVKKRIAPYWGIAAIPYLGGLILLADALCIFRPANNRLLDDIADTKVVPAA